MERRRLGMAVALLATWLMPRTAGAVVTEGDYYIYNDFYEKLLTVDPSDSGKPTLMTYVYSRDSLFVFTAEASGTDGYVKLRQKGTGKYLTASTSNQWSVLLSEDGTGDQYLWAFDQRFSTKIVSKKNTSKRLGCDFSDGSSTYYMDADQVPVYYNKGAGSLNWFSIIPISKKGFTTSRNACETDEFINEYGNREKDDYQVSTSVTVDSMDYHIVGNSPFSGSGQVNLKSNSAWLVFENIRPSTVISNYLSKVKINGSTATNGKNCRVEMWLRGAVVIPTISLKPFVATTDDGTFNETVGNHTDLGKYNNAMTSFTLRRGYMATLGTDANLGDYSRVYVADHADLTVTLPTPLYKRVSSVYIRKWHYTGKSGYANTKSDLLSAANACGASWCWNWDASRSSSSDIEYIPIKQHIYWPSNSNINQENSTAMMLFNEPEHSEQHSSCDCGGTIDAWKAYTKTGDFNYTGMRIGSPSATDLTYLKNYETYCDNMKQRCDFTCTHGYWSTEWSSNLSTLKGYGRPIWITEWEYGASWTSGTNPSSWGQSAERVFNILEMLEYNDYVEHYAYYEFDTGGTNGYMRELFWNNTYSDGLTMVGKLYAQVKPHFGYKASIQPVPNWWAPTAYSPSITECTLQDGQYVLTVENKNADCTGTFEVQKQLADGTWTTLTSVTDRSLFDASTQTVALEGVEAGTVVKVVLTTLFDASKQYESSTLTLPEYRTYQTLQNLTFDEGECVAKNVLTYQKDIKNTATETAQQQPVEGWLIPANGDAHAAGQYAVGSSYYLGGTDFLAPTANSQGTTEGGLLGLLACWTGTVQYTQHVILPAGEYTMTVPVYNSVGGTTAFTKNLIGFIEDNGTEHLATATTYPVGEWTTETLSFTLDTETLGAFTLGYTADNKSSSVMPHLFIDYVALTQKVEPPTVVKAIPASSPQGTSASSVFDLSGRRRSDLQHGVNIVDGKKVIR